MSFRTGKRLFFGCHGDRATQNDPKVAAVGLGLGCAMLPPPPPQESEGFRGSHDV